MAASQARYASSVVLSKAELLKAATENRPDPLLRYLTEGGGLEEMRNDERQTLLHVAAMEGAEDCVTLLLQSPKAIRKLNSRDRASRTALHLASAMGYEGCAQRLLEANASLDLQDEKGCTPLHLAVKFEWPETARVLLDAGADPLLEDIHGFNAVDMANDKGDGDAASLIASFARRRQPSALGQLKRCLLPNFFFGGSRRPHADPSPLADGSGSPAEPGSLPPPSMMGAPRLQPPESLPPVGQRVTFGEDGLPPDQPPASSAAAFPSAAAVPIPPADAKAAAGRQDPQEDWQGLELVAGQRPGAGAAGAGASGSAAGGAAAPSPLAAALEGAAAAARGEAAAAAGQQARGRAPAHASDDLLAPEPAAPSPAQAPSAQQEREHPEAAAAACSEDEAQAGSDNDEACEEFAMFRLQAFFEEDVKRLEFEVEWKEGQPSVGAVKPKGEAARRGIVSGDRLVEIAGAKTTGKGREELLPLLKTRPLLLKIDREERVMDPQEPHLELELRLRGEEGEATGLEVAFRGQLPVAMTVRPGSVAWRSGVLEGDGIFRLDGKDVTKESKSALQAAVNGRPQTLTVWRRPQGVELSTPWHLLASVGGS